LPLSFGTLPDMTLVSDSSTIPSDVLAFISSVDTFTDEPIQTDDFVNGSFQTPSTSITDPPRFGHVYSTTTSTRPTTPANLLVLTRQTLLEVRTGQIRKH